MASCGASETMVMSLFLDFALVEPLLRMVSHHHIASGFAIPTYSIDDITAWVDVEWTATQDMLHTLEEVFSSLFSLGVIAWCRRCVSICTLHNVLTLDLLHGRI